MHSEPEDSVAVAPRFSPHLVAILQALLVTFLWSLSWVFIKIGLREAVPPITFAALRYVLAAACLIPLILANPRARVALRGLNPREWVGLTLLGVVYYTATQGLQYVALAVLPAATLTLLLSMTPVIVAIAAQRGLGERLSWMQWAGLALVMGGTIGYFFPIALPPEQAIGVGFGVLALLANATSALMGRKINQAIPVPLVVTGVSMTIGAVLMMGVGVALEGIVALSWQTWLMIIFLAVVNTAVAFTLWNHTLRTLPAVESSVINNTMTVQIALLAFLFLGETLTAQQILGLGVTVIGVLAVQLGRGR
jgi:drug/metabolite transporter (DMT)-like permease